MAKRFTPSPARKQNLGLLILLLLALVFYRPAGLPGITTAAAQSEAGSADYLLIMRDNTALANLQAIDQAEATNKPGDANNPGLQTDAVVAARRARVINTLQEQSNNSQKSALNRLEELRAAGKIRTVRPLWVINAISVEIAPGASDADILAELAGLDGVAKVRSDPPLVLTEGPLQAVPAAQAQTASPAQNIRQIDAPLMWQMGYTGEGIVVANLDSGVSLNNSDLNTKWRGGSNSWLDTHKEHSKPTDVMGHGTATMGIMVSTNYGVAPGAKWIAVKMFSDNGSATLKDALLGLEWVLDPDGNPATDDGADVVNNSWSENTPGCSYDADLHMALQAMLAAGVLPVFSAGNEGPNAATAPVPSNYPEVLAVGAVDASHKITYFSSRGPTSCRASGQVFPDIVAPGSWITSSGLDDSYVYINSGTSFSAPHAAGSLALLLQAYPNLSAELQRAAIRRGAIDYWGGVPNNTYGYGHLNIYNSYYQMGLMLGVLTLPYRTYFPILYYPMQWP